jgi:hypothetical protein
VAELDAHVFPLRSQGKTPAFDTSWPQLATQDPGRFASWFGPYNIGIATGPSGLLVVDLDTAKGQAAPPEWSGARHGGDVLRQLAQQRGRMASLRTYTVATPTGGRHLYFRRPEGLALGNSQGRLGWKIDTRGVGGYVVAAGSTTTAGGYAVIRADRVAALPLWLPELLRPAPPPAMPAEQPPRVHSSRYGQVAVDEQCAQIRQAAPGTRHSILLTAALKLGSLVKEGVLNHDEVREALLAAATGHIGVEQFTVAEARRTVDDGLAYAMPRPGRSQAVVVRGPAGTRTPRPGLSPRVSVI